MRILRLLLPLAMAAAESWFPPERARGGQLWQDFVRRHPYAASPEEAAHTWDAPVDHFDARDTSTYQQRYFLDAQYVQPSTNSTLVFLLIGGEGTLTGPPKGFVAELGKEYGALLVALEHRFYGKSFPHHDMTTKSYQKYLTVDQVQP